MKFHIAEDGCSEVQYDLARQLLEENSGTVPFVIQRFTLAKTHFVICIYYYTESGEQTNHSLGVHWLMRAADQGHQNALQMLSECFRTRRGIDDRNECEVCPRPTTMYNEKAVTNRLFCELI